jgi:hypothetical protein
LLRGTIYLREGKPRKNLESSGNKADVLCVVQMGKLLCSWKNSLSIVENVSVYSM